jgi:anti-anti-sigma factor
MEFHFSDNDSRVELKGQLTYPEHPVFRIAATRLLNSPNPKAMVIDLQGVDFIDSAGLGMLLIARTEAAGSNRKLILRRPVGQVKRMFEISQFDTLFTIEA